MVQSKNGMMPKVENMELNVTSRPHVQVVLNELGCHSLGRRLGHVLGVASYYLPTLVTKINPDGFEKNQDTRKISGK